MSLFGCSFSAHRLTEVNYVVGTPAKRMHPIQPPAMYSFPADNDVSTDCVDDIYSSTVSVLLEPEAWFVSKRSKGFLNSGGMKSLMFSSKLQYTNNAWKMAGKPCSGPIFDKRQEACAT